MNSLDAAFRGCEQSHFFDILGSFVTAKMSNKREEFVQRGGRQFVGSTVHHFLCDENLGESIMLFLLKSTILSYTWLLLTIEVQFCNFQRGGLEDFTVNV